MNSLVASVVVSEYARVSPMTWLIMMGMIATESAV